MTRPSLTVVAVTGVNQNGHAKAVSRTISALPEYVRDFTLHSITHIVPGMDLVLYSRFMVKDLFRIIGTDFALTVQADGYGINPHNWTDEFLDYDYIGAPWPYPPYVGNGGVSIRSRKFLEASSQMPEPEFAEDQWLCCTCRPDMEALGIRFAPRELAARFSFEHPDPEIGNSRDKAWAVHGSWNL